MNEIEDRFAKSMGRFIKQLLTHHSPKSMRIFKMLVSGWHRELITAYHDGYLDGLKKMNKSYAETMDLEIADFVKYGDAEDHRQWDRDRQELLNVILEGSSDA